ncbi:hypothetical protein BIY28_23295 [Brenneria goodwinii]|nr:hypothetical protein BIY28_23295 [Brenneria goodwinii]
MINWPGPVSTSIRCPVVKPSGFSDRPLMVNCGNGLGLPPLGRLQAVKFRRGGSVSGLKNAYRGLCVRASKRINKNAL